MNTDLAQITTPEEAELQSQKAELDRLSALLAEKELELADLKRSLARFEHRYYAEVGKRYVELDELRAQIAELRAQQAPQDHEATYQAQVARDEADRSAREYHQTESARELPAHSEEPAADTKVLYRKIAKLIHPDKATDPRRKPVCEKLCAELNTAYDRNDVERMKAILAEWQASPESVPGDGTAFELVRVIRAIAQVKRRIEVIQAEISEIAGLEMYQLMIIVADAELTGRNILQEMSRSLDADTRRANEELQALKRKKPKRAAGSASNRERDTSSKKRTKSKSPSAKAISASESDFDGTVESRLQLDEGVAILRWPDHLCAASVTDLEHWMQGIISRAKRNAGTSGTPSKR